MTVIEKPGWLPIEIEDNGIGGADPAGPGLRGLATRVTALDGHVAGMRMPPANADDGLRAALELRAHNPGPGVLVFSQYRVTCSKTG